MPSSDSDTDSDEGIDENREATTWDVVEDLINDEEPEEHEIFVTGKSADEGMSPLSSPLTESELREGVIKFRDPLGILRMAPRGLPKSKIPDVEDEGFDSVKVLASVHAQTSYDELVGGARRLTRKLSSQEEDIKQLVRDNFDRFISSKDVIDNLYSLISENEISTKGTGTVKLEYTYNDIYTRAKKVFGPLLARQDETEKIRQALSVLSRFAFIFGLPSKIASNIKLGEFDKAVQNYKKAVALAEDSKVGLFQKVMAEVEAIITEFRTSLYTSLADPSASFEAQVKIIRLLVELGRKSTSKDQEDPGWFYLQNTASRLIALLNDSKSVKIMCTIVTRQIPNIWKMGMHYLGGKFDANSKQRAQAQAHPEMSRKSSKLGGVKDTPKTAAAPIRVYYVDETFASLRVDPAKTCADIIDQCMRRLPLEETELYTVADFAIYTWIEKRKKEGTKIKVTELAGDEKLFKIHKKWGDSKSGNTHKFLFKRKAEKFPKVIDSRDKVIISNLEDNPDDKVAKDTTEKKATGKMRSETDFYALVSSILQVFSTKVEHMLFTDAAEQESAGLDRMSSDPEMLSLDSGPSSGSDQGWIFDQMREDATNVFSTQSAVQRAGIRDKPLAVIAGLTMNIGRTYVTRVCSQWAAEVSLLYLSAQKGYQDGADATPLFSATHLPNQFYATSRFYLSQIRGIGIHGRNHPLLPQVQTAFAEIIRCFADCLHHLAFTSVTSQHQNMRHENSGFGFVSQFTSQDLQRIAIENYPSHNVGMSVMGGGGGGGEGGNNSKTDEVNISRDGYMIAGLSHAEYTRLQMVPQLWKFFLEDFKIGSADQKPDEEIAGSLEVLQLLGAMFMDRYIHAKSLTLNYITRKGIHLSGVDWGVTVSPVSVSEYIMTMLLHFVYIHAEVTSISGNFADITSRVMESLMTNALLGLHKAVLQLEGYGIWGLWQLRLDLDFFTTILSNYSVRDNEAIAKNVDDLLDKYEDDLGDHGVDDARAVKASMNTIVEETVKKSTILFSCLLEKT